MKDQMPLLATLIMENSCANVIQPQTMVKLVTKIALKILKKTKLLVIFQNVFVLEQTPVQASKMINVTFALTSITPKMIVPKNVMIQKLCLSLMMLASHVKMPKNLPEENV